MVIPGNLSPNRHAKALQGPFCQPARSPPRHDSTGLIMVINGTKPVDRRTHTHTHTHTLINVGRSPTGPCGLRLGQQGPLVAVEPLRPPITNVGTETAFRHATMASISKKVNISWGQRSVDAITGLDRTRGCCVPPKKRGGATNRAVSAQCEVRLKMATAKPAWGKPNHRKPYAMLCGSATWGRFFRFLRGSGNSGSAVTNISGSTGYLTSETN